MQIANSKFVILDRSELYSMMPRQQYFGQSSGSCLVIALEMLMGWLLVHRVRTESKDKKFDLFKLLFNHLSNHSIGFLVTGFATLVQVLLTMHPFNAHTAKFLYPTLIQ
ncbi:uncharacterized protein LOC129310312 [Prosopis cineraria]|uniref:uncharacterized protein LOC129310312 n=1 Tax=Prosopis cineraria TaxID=364024 RepID=UPI0024104CAD|nr:uncharacterized protein LOC129310312 [Prosopis cineraria]XP_054808104.1 uncharacterized protein LOC129310312 [Prosopis cineraria]XP_054808105.1 uncharacterized protein LOC129310312 [Prosopis cineraria]